ncbi:MAG: hypothetical protein ACX94D_15080 [Henriciella sp.]|jgi:hypothetical protein|mmetsp:Transcript_4425/g.7030  ORF Transcript_4425/g.7030 Transcript_4425/m.7030 type:complete len:178 (-) Transcript_4425:40-573(-)|eukprot:CAMPEP_0183776834 /NCGR_PEP_ID=MMETSP0739-20130205/47723_1 /TAXON_ID=385413 /ORGANISM="Thalassiosira miniscula, Strain CCMP1093" /LENGTH=177 /DNA_ID=CAMNT_0026018801 /DNA_START=43 /DNA_END=576 /DNA_ORIENTATION=-
MFKPTLAAATLTLAFAATPNIAETQNNEKTPKRFTGIYSFQGQTDSVSGPFGTLSCTDFQQFAPDLICANSSLLELREDGTASTTIAGIGDFSDSYGTWSKTDRREITINWISIVYDPMGVATNWALQTTVLSFAPGLDDLTTTFEINWYPIADDPTAPMNPPDITFSGSSTGQRFN